MSRPLEIRVHDLHVDIMLNGVILAHSEDYSSVSKANRAADALVDAINYRELKLIKRHWFGRSVGWGTSTSRARRLWQPFGADYRPLSMPAAFSPTHKLHGSTR